MNPVEEVGISTGDVMEEVDSEGQFCGGIEVFEFEETCFSAALNKMLDALESVILTKSFRIFVCLNVFLARFI